MNAQTELEGRQFESTPGNLIGFGSARLCKPLPPFSDYNPGALLPHRAVNEPTASVPAQRASEPGETLLCPVRSGSVTALRDVTKRPACRQVTGAGQNLIVNRSRI